MTEDIKHIHSYYSPHELYNRIIAGLNDIGNAILTKTYNLSRNLNEERVSLIEAVAKSRERG